MRTIILQNWFQLTAIQVGGVICLPAVMIGFFLVKNYGVASALLGLGIGNLTLMVLGLLMCSITLKKRISTIEIAAEYFGQKGVQCCALAMLVSLSGWFAINLTMMTESSLQVLLNKNEVTRLVITLLLGSSIIGIVNYGIKALERFATLSLPLLLFILGYSVYQTKTGNIVDSGRESIISLTPIFVVISAGLTMVFDLPTYYRFAVSLQQARISIVILFGLAVPAIEGVGVYLAAYNQQGLMEMLTQTSHPIWQIIIVAFFILAGATTNTANLFSCAVNTRPLLPTLSETKRIIGIGIAATLGACMPIMQHFEALLEGIGLMMGGMGAIIIISYYLPTNIVGQSKDNIVILIVATVQGLMTLSGLFSLSGNGIVDTALIAALMRVSLTLIRKKRNAY